MAKAFLLFSCILFSLSAVAQKKKKPAKPQVLVYGHAAEAFSAAVQSAQSGVETLWIVDSSAIGGSLIQGEAKQVASNEHLDVGIWALFLSKVANATAISDSASHAAKGHITPRIAQNAFEGITDTVKRLKVKKNLTIMRIDKSGKGWQLTLSNKEKIKVRAFVDASTGKSPIYAPKTTSATAALAPYPRQTDYTSTLYRTGIAVAQIAQDIFTVPLKYILPDSAQANYFITGNPNNTPSAADDLTSLPLRMLKAQACGAAAAYCAFFNTSSNKINARTLQGELLAFKSVMVPFQDIGLDDPHYPQIQRVGATGMLRGHYTADHPQKRFLFDAQQTVSSTEVEPVFRQLYTRSQIWFKDKEIEALRLRDLLELIKYIAHRGDELQAEVEKGWTKRFQFKQAYDLDYKLSRREFAVLVDTYLQPFNVRVNLDGKLTY